MDIHYKSGETEARFSIGSIPSIKPVKRLKKKIQIRVKLSKEENTTCGFNVPQEKKGLDLGQDYWVSLCC